MSDMQTRPIEARDRFDSAADFVGEDIENQLLRYHLLRLTVVGLRRQEIEPLLALARQAFAEADVTEQVEAITGASDSSPLAVAIAGIVAAAPRAVPGSAPRASAMTGAVVGAYAALRDDSSDRMLTAVLGAVGGALARSFGPSVDEQIARVGTAAYLQSLPDGND
jgi:hypothetical protein